VKKYFVTGTDTGVGKTLVTCALLNAANNLSMRTLGLKPLAAGCEDRGEGLRNEDALAIQQVSSVKLDYSQVNPVALKQAIAPHIAAANEGRRLSVDRLLGFSRGALCHKSDFCLMEGAGGWRLPLNKVEYLSALPKALNMDVILVVGMRLGCLNHALLSAEAIVRDGVKIRAWVANVMDPEMPFLEENLKTLQSLLPFPCLGLLPWLGSEIDLDKASDSLVIEPLL